MANPVIVSGGTAVAKETGRQCPPPVIASGGTAVAKEMVSQWSVAISTNDPERMPEIASLHIDIIPFADLAPALAMTGKDQHLPFADLAPALAMTEHTPVIASGGTAVAKGMVSQWSVAISTNDPERMPEIASLHSSIIPFADPTPALAMTGKDQHLPFADPAPALAMTGKDQHLPFANPAPALAMTE